jgi:hypothetical protein
MYEIFPLWSLYAYVQILKLRMLTNTVLFSSIYIFKESLGGAGDFQLTSNIYVTPETART